MGWIKRSAAAQTEAPLRHRTAVFGTDERIALPPKYNALRNSVGLLLNNRARTACSAFCVGDSIVASAAHCLFRTLGERLPRLDDFWFARRLPDRRSMARIAGAETGSAAQHVMAGSVQLSLRPPIDATSDWALIQLDRPACLNGALPIRAMTPDEIAGEAESNRLFQVAFHRDFIDWRLAYSRPCGALRHPAVDRNALGKDFSAAENLILHTCDTGGASSGSPLLIDGVNGPEVVGINVGTYVQTRIMMQDGEIVHRFKSDNVANTGVSARAFANKLPVFRTAQILASGPPLKILQQRLKILQVYDGPADGIHGSRTRNAISSLEQTRDLPVTGLPTVALLRHLDEAIGGTDTATTTLQWVGPVGGPAGPAIILKRPEVPRR